MTLACVTGSTGFIGRHLCEQLVAQAIALRTAHSGSQASALLTDVVKRSESELASALEGADVVYHLAGIAHEGVRGTNQFDMLEVNRDLTLRLYRAALLSGVKIFVWLSTLKVLGDVAEEPVGLDAPYRPRGTYAQSKAQTEQTLLALPTQATELVIVRPPLVYGPNVKGNFRRLLQLCRTPLPLPFEAAQGKRSMVGVRNLVSLLMHLGDKGGDPESRIVHVRDTQEWSVNSLVEELRRLMGQPNRQFCVSDRSFRALAKVLKREELASRLIDPLRVDASESERRLGWQATRPSVEQLEETVTWFQRQR